MDKKDSGEHDFVTSWLERRRNTCPMYEQDLEIRMEISWVQAMKGWETV